MREREGVTSALRTVNIVDRPIETFLACLAIGTLSRFGAVFIARASAVLLEGDHDFGQSSIGF